MCWELHVWVIDLFSQDFQAVSVVQEGDGDLDFVILLAAEPRLPRGDADPIPVHFVLAKGALAVDDPVEVLDD
jgi:hypothetical protein